VRRAVAEVVKGLGPNGKAAAPALIENLKRSSDEYTQQAFIEALGAIGAQALEACPALAQMVPELGHESEATDKRIVRTQLLRTVEKTLEQIGCVPQAPPGGP
jgi:HEAT repeat protein